MRLEALACATLAAGAALSPSKKLGDSVPGLSHITNILGNLNSLLPIGSPCSSCKHFLGLLKKASHNNEDLVSSLLGRLCTSHDLQNSHHRTLCESLHLYGHHEVVDDANETFSFLTDLRSMLSMMNPSSVDGDYFCHYMMAGACPVPERPCFDETKWWPAKNEVERMPTARSSGHTFNVLHVSDVHLSINYSRTAPTNCMASVMCCNSDSIQDPTAPKILSPKWGHYRCDAPPALLDATLQASVQEFDYDFALFTGDMVDHNPVFISRHDTLLEEAETLRALKRELKGIPVFPVLGNHDSYPYGQSAPPGSKYARRTEPNIELMEELWADWIGKKAAQQVRTSFGAYVVHPRPGLKIITLNSNYWYRWNFYNYGDTRDPDPSGAIAWAIEELLDCERKGTKAWIQAHVPPGGVVDEALPPASELLSRMFERFSENIAGIFFGHTHFDEFTVLYSHNGKVKNYDNALNVAWVAPSVTPFTDLNPSWRWYEVDADTFEIMDSHTHYAAIDSAFGLPWEEAPDLIWRKEYSAREAYGANWPENEPLNGKFWHMVATNILTKPHFSQRFIDRAYRYSLRAPACTSYECRVQHFCYATSMSVDQVVECYADKAVAKSKRLHGIPTFPMPRSSRHDLVNVTNVGDRILEQS